MKEKEQGQGQEQKQEKGQEQENSTAFILCQKITNVFPDMIGLASYLSKKTNYIPVNETSKDFEYQYSILQRTRLYRLFTVAVGALISAGFGVKYAIRKWTSYIEKRKGTPSQRNLEQNVLSDPSVTTKLLKVNGRKQRKH